MASSYDDYKKTNESTYSWLLNMVYKAAIFVFTWLRWLYEFIIKALAVVSFLISILAGSFIKVINYHTKRLTQPESHNTRHLSAAIKKIEHEKFSEPSSFLVFLLSLLSHIKSKSARNHLLIIYSSSVYLIEQAAHLIDTLIHIAVRLFKLPYDLIQKTLEYISKAITSDEMKQKKYSHFITKISLLTLTTFIYLQYSPKLSDNPISNYFKNLFKKLGIQLNKNALTASLISMTIFFVLFMFRTPVESYVTDQKQNTNKVNPLDKYQFTFFMMLSVAAGPIAYTLMQHYQHQ